MDRKREIEALEKGEFMKRPQIGDKVKVFLSCNGNHFTFGIVTAVIFEEVEKVILNPCGFIHWSKVDYFLPDNRVKFKGKYKTFIHKQVIF